MWEELLRTRGSGALDLALELSTPREKTEGEARSIGVPLLLSGFEASLLPEFTRWCESRGLSPVQAGGAGSAGADLGPEALVPGAAIGAQIIRGDANATAIGTVTWRQPRASASAT